MSDKPKVYIVDDSLIFRAMLETSVSRDPNFEICGVAASADEALEDIGWMLPDIILLDLNFRTGMDGLRFLDEVAGHWHQMDIIVVSSDAQRGSDVCKEAFRRGAAACFNKAQVIASGRSLLELMQGIRSRNLLSERSLGRAVSLPAVQH